MNRQGFTLVEMLVAMAILSIVMGALLALTTGTLSFSATAMSTSARQRELNDATGYIADSIRRASTVYVTTATATVTLNGDACKLTPAASSCFSVVVPEATGGSTINRYMQLFYRVEPRSSLETSLKVSDGWSDANTYVIKEYRQELCGSSTTACTATPPTGSTTATIATGALVVDEVSLVYGTTTYQPFSYDGNGKFTLKFRVAQQRRNKAYYTPAASDAPYTLTVSKRN